MGRASRAAAGPAVVQALFLLFSVVAGDTITSPVLAAGAPSWEVSSDAATYLPLSGDDKLPRVNAVITYRLNITNNDTAVLSDTHRLNLTLVGLTPDSAEAAHALSCKHDNGTGDPVVLHPNYDVRGTDLLAAYETVTCSFSISAANQSHGVLPAVTIYAQLLDNQTQASGLDSSITIGPVPIYSGSTLRQEPSVSIIDGGILINGQQVAKESSSITYELNLVNGGIEVPASSYLNFSISATAVSLASCNASGQVVDFSNTYQLNTTLDALAFLACNFTTSVSKGDIANGATSAFSVTAKWTSDEAGTLALDNTFYIPEIVNVSSHFPLYAGSSLVPEGSSVSLNGTYVVVHDVAVPKEGSIVSYYVTVQNGAANVSADSYLVLEVSGPNTVPLSNVSCGNYLPVQWNQTTANAGVQLTSGLDALSNITCQLNVQVTQAHAAAGSISSFYVTAQFAEDAYGNTSLGDAYHIAGNLSIDEVTVNTGSQLMYDSNHLTANVSSPSVTVGNGDVVPLEGSVITYFVTVQNGAANVSANKYLVLEVSGPNPVPISSVSCGNYLPVQWNQTEANAGVQLTSGLDALSNITCQLTVQVTQAHAEAGKVSSFHVTALFAEDAQGNTPLGAAYYVDKNVSMPQVTVNTGSRLSIVNSTTLELEGSFVTVNSTTLPQCNGYVRYYFTLTNGARAIPAGSILLFSTTAGSHINISNPQCFLYSDGANATVQNPISADSPQLAAHVKLMCSVDALVNEMHAEWGYLPAFYIQGEYGSTNESEGVFFMPPLSTGIDVPVHTGSKLEHVKTEVNTTQPDTYFTVGEQTNLVKQGGTVRYTLKLTNGAQEIQSNNTLDFAVTHASAANRRCWWNSSAVLVPLHPDQLGSPIRAGDMIMCSFDVLVLDEHENDGELPSLTVQAAYNHTSNVLYIPTITGQIPPWPVYTNSTMSSITYRVDTIFPTAIYADGTPTRPIAQETGKVTYTVTIINGDKAVPANSSLTVTTSIGNSINDNKCSASTPEVTAGIITLDASNLPALPKGMIITCLFDVDVTHAHKLQGQIDPISVSAKFTGTGLFNDTAFHIPNVTSEAVPVYTGGLLKTLSFGPAPNETKYYTALGNDNVYQPGARVRYFFTFETGVKDFPNSSQLTLTTSTEVPVSDSFNCSTPAGQPIVTAGLTIPGTVLSNNTTYTCHFDIEVIGRHQSLGMISPFSIELTPNANLTDAYHIHSNLTQDGHVLVYTGATLSYESYCVGTQFVQLPQAQADLASAPFHLAAVGGIVDYTIRLSIGSKAIPSGSTIRISADPPGATFGPCRKVSGGIVPLGNVTWEDFLPPTQIDCNVSVPVNLTHKALGRIPGLSINMDVTAFGSTTGSKEYYIPSVPTPDVPVYTGGHLDDVTSAVVTTAGASVFYADIEDQGALVKLDGKVNYMVVLTTGVRDIPIGSNLTLTNASSGSPATPDITTFSDAVCKSAGHSDMVPGLEIPEGSGNASVSWNCSFAISVTTAHQAAGKIGQFDVRFGYTDGAGTPLSAAYFIPMASTDDVPVYTGAYLTYEDVFELVPGPNVITANDTPIVQPGKKVRYHFVLKNGVLAVPLSSTLLFTSSDTGVTLSNSSCIYSNAEVPTTTDPSDDNHPIVNSTQLSAGTEFTCTVDVNVNATHAAAAKLPSFSILAKYKGTGITRAFHIDSKSSPAVPEVPVYTGANLTSPVTEVVNTPETFFQVNGSKLVKAYGQVKYRFTFNAGAAEVPTNSSLALSTAAGPPLLHPVCTTNTVAGGVISNHTLTPDIETPSTAISTPELLAADLVWDCEFLVNVTPSHETAGKIDSFDVQLAFGGPAALTKAFYVPKLRMPTVYVYTGGVLTVGSSTVVETTGVEGVEYHETGLGDPLVAAGGKVTYTMTLRTGEKILPNNGNRLDLSFDRANVSVVGGACNKSGSSDEYDVGMTLTKAVPAKTDLICRFEVQPGIGDQDAASIAPFNVTATFSGPDTTNYEFFIPTGPTPEVLVYAGGKLQSPRSQVVNADGSDMDTDNGTWVTADDNQPLVMENGHVNYTVYFAAGAKPIPLAGTEIALETDGPTPIPGSIQCTNGSDTLSAPGPVGNVAMNNQIWACSFKILVTNAHKLAGQMPQFNVQVKFNGSDLSLKAFYVPKIQVPVVHVYTGATFTKHEFAVDRSYNTMTTDAGNVHKTSGKISYTVKLNTGSKLIGAQDDNTLHLEFNRSDATVVNCSTSQATVPVGRPLTADLSASTLVTCEFYTLLSEADKTASQINPVRVKAKINGSSTTRQFYIPPAYTDTVPVGRMTVPQGAGVFTTATDYHNHVPLVAQIIREGGRVKYTFNMTTGATAVPSGATLRLNTPSDLSVSSAVCNSASPLGLQLSPEVNDYSSPVTNTSLLAANIEWNCEFTVDVKAAHEAAGKIAPFLAGLEWGTVPIAYYIDPQIANEVLVHTGTSMALGVVAVNTTTPYIDVLGTPLVMTSGKVTYSFNITIGAKAVPANSILNITITGATPVAPVANSLGCDLNGAAFPLGQPWGNAGLDVNAVLHCSFEILVLDEWTDEGHIPEITVAPVFTPSNIVENPAAIFYVEPKMFASELVYTNSAMSYITTAVMTADQNASIDDITYYTGVIGADPLVRVGGTVEYTVFIVNGNRTIPANSTLHVTTHGGYNSTLEGSCKYGNPEVDVSLESAMMPEIDPRGAIKCTFLVVVTEDHKNNGEIGPFVVKAELSGPNITIANHIPTAFSPSVPVHTGGQLSNVSSQVLLDDSTNYFTVGATDKLVKEGGKVQYTFNITQGSKEIPPDSVLTITSTPSQTVVGNPSCTSGLITITHNMPVPASTELAGLSFICTYTVQALPTHRDIGQIPAVTFRVKYGGAPNITSAYYVKEIVASPVPVHTGAVLQYLQYAIDTSGGSSKYIELDPTPSSLGAANYTHLVKAGGKVKFAVKLHTGHKDVPDGNRLTLQTNTTVVSMGPCALNNGSRIVELDQILAAPIPKNHELTCEIVVDVNDTTHVQAGEVPPFLVTAVYSGPNTSTNEYYVQPQSTSSVPVYTGTHLETPTSKLQDISFYVDGVAGVLATGKVNYTVVFYTGACAIPPSTTLHLATNNINSSHTPDITPTIAPVCINETGSDTRMMTPGSQIPTDASGADIIWTCTFALNVTPNYKSGGLMQIDAFEVMFTYSGTSITPAFHIPAIATNPAPIYTGGVMAVAPGVVETTGSYADKFIEDSHGQNLVVNGGQVFYELTLSTGLLDIPINSSLDIRTDVSGLTVSGPCYLNGTGDIDLRVNLGFIIPRNKTITCKVLVNVTTDHQVAAEVAPFQIIAEWSGAAGVEYYVPPIRTLSVPVYTGGILAQPSSQVNEVELGIKYHTAKLSWEDATGTSLVAAGGSVKYTVLFTAGKAPLPPGTTVSIVTTSSQQGGITPINPNIVCITNGSSGLDVSMSTPGPVAADFLRANINWTCTFDISVTTVHKAAGQINSFEVSLSFNGGVDVTEAYYVPTIMTPVVKVYTGNAFTPPVPAVDISNASLYYSLAPNDILVKKDGVVEYTITIHMGEKDLPASGGEGGNHLEILTEGYGNLTGPCTMAAADITLGTSSSLPAIPKNSTIVCKHSVRVTQAHQDAAEIAAFTIRALFTRPNTTIPEFHVPNIETPSVPVYTGGELAQPTSRVVQTAGKYYNDAVVTQGRDLVKPTGRVEYTVMFTSGTSRVPPGSRLAFYTSGGISPIGTVCTLGAWSLYPNQDITEDILSNKSVAGGPLLNWTCNFEVQVSQSQQAAGQIAPFDVQLSFTPRMPAWFIPKTTTLAVPVWSGATLSYVRQDVVQSNSQFYAVAASQYLVKEAGLITYTFAINTGFKALPSGHHLVLNTTIGVVPDGLCTIASIPLEIPLVAGAGAIAALLNPNTNISCSFNVTANNTHKLMGEIAPFNVKAQFTGPNTVDGIYFVAGTVEDNGGHTTPSVPVYTGGVLGTPSSAVVEADPSTFIVVDGTPLVKEGGALEYTFSFTSGAKDLPSAARFSVTLSNGLTARIPICKCDTGAVNLTINADTPIANPAALTRDLIWECKFQVLVGNSHKLAGEVPAFLVQFTWSGTGITDAYYVPKVPTTAVPVYTGAMLGYVSNVADTTDPTKFIDVNSVPFAKPDGKVIYTITLTNGVKAVPTGSTLALTASNSVALLNPVCNHATAGNISLGQAITDTAKLMPGLVITCTVEVVVTQDYQQAGQISAFDIIATYAGPSITRAYHVISTRTVSVLVYQNLPMLLISSEVSSTNASLIEMVNGAKTVRAGAQVTYTVIVISGETNVTTASKLSIPVTATDLSIPEAVTHCRVSGVSRNATWQLDLPAQTALVCHFKYVVTSDMAADGQLPVLSIMPKVMVADLLVDYVAAAQVLNVGAGFPSHPVAAGPVPVYVGPRMTAISSPDAAATATYLAVDGVNMPKGTASIRYTVTLTNGILAVPTGSRLAFDIASTVTYSGLSCNSGAVVPGTAVTNPTVLAAQSIITCIFNVAVTTAHVTAGRVPEFTITARWTDGANVALDDAYDIPQLMVASVPVITGQPTIYVKHAVAGSSLVRVRGVDYAQVDDGVTYTVILVNGDAPVATASNLVLQLTSEDPAYPQFANSSCTTTPAPSGATALAAEGLLRCVFTIIVKPYHVMAGRMPSFRVRAVTGTTQLTAYAPEVTVPAVNLYYEPALTVLPVVTGTEGLTFQLVNRTNRMAAAGGVVSYQFRLVNGPVNVPNTISINLASNSTVFKTFSSCTVSGSSQVLPINGLAPFAVLSCIITYTVTKPDIIVGSLASYGVRASRYPRLIADGEVLQYASVQIDTLPLFTGIPCSQCRSCISGMFTFIEPLLLEADANRIATLFNTECRKTRAGELCDSITAEIRESPLGNKGKRAGWICKALKECQPELFEPSCSLMSTLVPHGEVDVCRPQGTTAGRTTLPNVIRAGTPLDPGFCQNDTQCSTSQLCANTSDPAVAPFTRCVCDSKTGSDTCEQYYSCIDSPCTICRKCFILARDFAATVQNEILPSAVAQAFTTFCTKHHSLEICSKVALQIFESYQGNLGKRPGWICRALEGCPADLSTGLPANCVISPNRTTTELVVTPANHSVCTVDGRSNGLLAPSMYRNISSPPPLGSCSAERSCNISKGEVCSYNAGLKFCVCDEATGLDECSDLGMCQAITCEECNKCIQATVPWIVPRLKSTNATEIAAAWTTHCTGTLKKTTAMCDVARNAILVSKNGNVGKRALTLCSFVYACSTSPGTPAASCRVNVSNTLPNATMPLLIDNALDICNIEGVLYGNPVPGVATTFTDSPRFPTIPMGNCTIQNQNQDCDSDHRCDVTTVTGGVCSCNSNDGTDACMDYYSCVRTPCKICSDCLTEMTIFAQQQMYSLEKSSIIEAFLPYCTKNWTASQCATVVTKFKEATTPLNFGKRAGSMCTTMGVCNPADIGSSCVVKPLASNSSFRGTTAQLDMCTVEGISIGSDVPGTSNDLTVPSGRCDTDKDCNNPDMQCVKRTSTKASFCTCYAGQDSCREIGTCLLKPCPACQACLTAFQPFTTSAIRQTNITALAASYFTACRATNRAAKSCETVSLAIANSYQGNLGRRSGAICNMLGECVPSTISSCSLTDSSSAGNFSLCTSSGISTGPIVTGFFLNTFIPAALKCIRTSDCNATRGEECMFRTNTLGCSCNDATGVDTCVPVGDCAVAPCRRCQTCLDTMNPVITRERNQTSPDTTAACQETIYTGCNAMKTKYVSATGASGFFGLRAGAQCAVLQQCTDLPATCTLNAVVGTASRTAGLDLCAAEGITGGSPVGQGIPPSACLKDADCGDANQQCDLSNRVTVWKCSGGLDAATPYGKCVATPPPPPQLTNCERCSICITNMRQNVEGAALNSTAGSAVLGQRFYATCSASNYSLTACREVQAAIVGSYAGNLARRAGALCSRLGECASSLSADASCTLSTTATAAAQGSIDGAENSTTAATVKGTLDVCTIEGVSAGRWVALTYRHGQAINNTCVLDGDCSAGRICSSSIRLPVCRCMNGIDSCDVLNTCQAPVVVAPVVVKTPCQRCGDCLNRVTAFVADTATDPEVLASRFLTSCIRNFTDNDMLVCKRISDAITYNARLAKRAGALCSRLGDCSDALLSADSRCNMTVGSRAGRLNLCERSGVGSSAASTVALSPTGCRSDADCLNGTVPTNRVCSFADEKSTSVQCTCSNGTDTCFKLGTCVNFCSTQQAYLNAVNAAVAGMVCTGPFSDCGVGMQCKASGQCKRLSCDPTLGITTTQCYGFCMAADRKVMGAKISDDGSFISVILNTAAAASKFACAALFDDATMEKLGFGAWCSATDKQLMIQLGPQSTILPEADKLTIRPAQSVLYDILDTTATFQGTDVPVAKCSACLPPTAVILGPKLVPEPCDATTAADVIFDASFSKDSSIRPLTKVSWSQQPAAGASNDMVLATAIDKANSGNNGAGSYRLIIPANQLSNMLGDTYTIKVTVTSILGISGSADLTFSKKASGSTPVITFMSDGEVPFKIADGVKVAVQLMADSVCPGKQVEYLWQPIDPSSWSAMPMAYKRKDLVLPGPVSGVRSGQRVTVQLTANFVGGTYKTQANVTLVASGSPLVAKLRGPSGDIRSDQEVVLNAAGSYDPDDPQATSPLSVSWECVRADYPAPCFMGSDYGNRTGMVWSFNAGILTPGLEHVFKAIIQRRSADGSLDEASMATASVKFTPTSAAIPTGRIRRVCGSGACPAAQNADAALMVTMALDSGSEAAKVSWNAVQIPQLGTIAGPDLLIPANMLPKANTITITATLDSGSETSTTSIDIPINGKPTCTKPEGCIVLDATTGAYPAKFTAEAAGFVDDQPELRYTFGVLSDSGTPIAVSSGPSPTYTFTGLRPGDRWLYVCATDDGKAQSCSQVKVTVSEPAADFNVADKLTSFDVSHLAGTGDVSVLAAGAQELEGLSKIASKADTATQSAEEQKQVASTIAAKTSSMISTLAGSAGDYVSDPDTMQQVVSTVATLTKVTNQLSKDAKDKMLSVAASGITAAKLNKKPVSPAEASRLWAVVAAASDMRAVCKAPGKCGAAAKTNKRRLQDMISSSSQELVQSELSVTTKQHRAMMEDASNATATAVEDIAELATSHTPGFLEPSQSISDLLWQSATPATGYLSGGDNGLFVSVANLLGRKYDTASIFAGPELDDTGDKADSLNGANARIQFNKPLVGPCVDEEGVKLSAEPCSSVVVPIKLTYLASVDPLLSTSPATAAKRKLLESTSLPAGWEIVSGAVILDIPGGTEQALPCDSCAATLTVPIWESPQPSTLYHCAHVVDGSVGLDTTAASFKASIANDSAPAVECTVTKSGSFVVGKSPGPTSQQGVVEAPPQVDVHVELGKPLLFTFTFNTADNFSVPTFLADSARVKAFSEGVKTEMVTTIAAQTLVPSMTADKVSVSNVRQGSILFDVEISSTAISDLAMLRNLASAIINRPETFFSQSFLNQYSVLTVTAAQSKAVAAAAAAAESKNIGAIVGGVVGGVGGFMLAAFVVLLMKRRRSHVIEPRGAREDRVDEQQAQTPINPRQWPGIRHSIDDHMA